MQLEVATVREVDGWTQIKVSFHRIRGEILCVMCFYGNKRHLTAVGLRFEPFLGKGVDLRPDWCVVV